MKQKKTILILLVVAVFQLSCTTAFRPAQKESPKDVRCIFIGKWEGRYVDADGHVVREWAQTRSKDGTYSIVFIHHTDKGVLRTVRKGTWWIEGDRFFELVPGLMKTPHEYHYDIVNKDEIFFKSVVTDYAFTDKRVKIFQDSFFK